MFIQTEATPNPDVLKFLPGRDVLGEGTREFRSAVEAEASPLAQAIFELSDLLRDGPILGDADDGHDTAIYDGDSAQIVAEIKDLLDTRIRPAVAQDGGDITFSKFEPATGVVWLHMRGACSGCPSSSATLKSGVENMLKHYVPEVTRVEQAV
jgi:Fe-S cluster biogenesis protein NfuA